MKKNKIFISHSSKDGIAINNFVNSLDMDKNEIFYSSNPSSGIDVGAGVSTTLDEKMEKCDIFVPIITENYVRSLYCIYEIGVAAFLKSRRPNYKILPICTSQEVYAKLESLLKRFDLLVVYTNKNEFQQEIKKKFQSLFRKNKNNLIEEFAKQLKETEKLAGSYIGGEDDYQNILKYCYSNNIKLIDSTQCKASILKEKISSADEITIVSTTGDALIKSLKDSFVVALNKQANINVILPNQYSPFIQDVASIESIKNPSGYNSNVIRLAQEYENIFGYLKEAYSIAKNNHKNLGQIKMYNSKTLLRQTFIITKRGEQYWIWCSLTMPPARTIDGTPSIMLQGKNEEGKFINAILNHVQSIINLSIANNEFIDITNNSIFSPFSLETKHAKEYWAKKIEIAKEKMERAKENSNGILIEVAAQHPLKNGHEPNAEFKLRLEQAIALYKKYKTKHRVMIYVPGSLHKFYDEVDKVSLSFAGKKYLIDHGIPSKNIYGEDANTKYKNKDGVYNSADECYVASKLFFDNHFESLLCICSPNQLFRKTLFYINFGILPLCFSVPTDKMFHSIIDEAFVNLQTVLYKDHDWQSKNSISFKNSRLERKPAKKK